MAALSPRRAEMNDYRFRPRALHTHAHVLTALPLICSPSTLGFATAPLASSQIQKQTFRPCQHRHLSHRDCASPAWQDCRGLAYEDCHPQDGTVTLCRDCGSNAASVTCAETVGLLGTGAQDDHLDLHTAPELWGTVGRKPDSCNPEVDRIPAAGLCAKPGNARKCSCLSVCLMCGMVCSAG